MMIAWSDCLLIKYNGLWLRFGGLLFWFESMQGPRVQFCKVCSGWYSTWKCSDCPKQHRSADSELFKPHTVLQINKKHTTKPLWAWAMSMMLATKNGKMLQNSPSWWRERRQRCVPIHPTSFLPVEGPLCKRKRRAPATGFDPLSPPREKSAWRGQSCQASRIFNQ